jgi:hypothetical protein
MNTCTQVVSTIVQLALNTRALHKYYDYYILHITQDKYIITGIFKLLDIITKLPIFCNSFSSLVISKNIWNQKKK